MGSDEREFSNRDLAEALKEKLNAESNEEVMSLLEPHLPGIRKPTPEEGYPDPDAEAEAAE